MRLFQRSKTVHLVKEDMLYLTNKTSDLKDSKNSFNLLDSVPEVKEIKLSESSQSCLSQSQTSVSSVKKITKNPDLIRKLLNGKHKVYNRVFNSTKRIPSYRIFNLGK